MASTQKIVEGESLSATCTSWSAYAGHCEAPAVRVSTGYWAHENWAQCAAHARMSDGIRGVSAKRA